MIGVGPGDRLGAPGLSGSAYDPRFGSTLGTTAYGACTRIRQRGLGSQRSFPSSGGQNASRSQLDLEYVVEVVVDH
jgi:hypothetical protein